MSEENILPVHVSIIMDGNGRWAKKRGLQRIKGHSVGVESVRVITETCAELGIPYLSLFAFGEENWGRPEAEVQGIMELMFKTIESEFPTMMKNGVRFRVLGNRARLSNSLNAAIDNLEQRTAGNTRLSMIVFMSYSGKWDLLQAAKKLAVSHPDGNFTEDDLSAALVTSGIPDPDLLIRTSGEQRLSNYLLWQSAYSEFYFTPVLWPDFRREDFLVALQEFARRDRRFGKVK